MRRQGSLLDVYARADITALCRSNAYNRLQWEDVTVGQALALGVRFIDPTLSMRRGCNSRGQPLCSMCTVLLGSAHPQPRLSDSSRQPGSVRGVGSSCSRCHGLSHVCGANRRRWTSSTSSRRTAPTVSTGSASTW